MTLWHIELSVIAAPLFNLRTSALADDGCLQPEHVAAVLLYSVHFAYIYVNVTADCHEVYYCIIQSALHCMTRTKC
jgi:hypothetical protein